MLNEFLMSSNISKSDKVYVIILKGIFASIFDEYENTLKTEEFKEKIKTSNFLKKISPYGKTYSQLQ